QRRRAAADVDAAEARRAPAQLDLADERVDDGRDPIFRPARGAPAVDHEVAIRAHAQAEREVDVQRDRRGRVHRPWFSETTSQPAGVTFESASTVSSSKAADGVTWPA